MTQGVRSLQKLDALQAGRGLAALAVVCYHCKFLTRAVYGPGAPDPLPFGFIGVDFFFALSGFLMVWVHLRDFGQPRRLGSYALKRIARIYPVYWALCLVIVPLTLLAPSLRDHQNGTAYSIANSVLLLPHVGPRLLNVTWTLEYEVLFYVAFSVFFFSRRLGSLIFGVWVALIAAANCFGKWLVTGSFSPDTFLLNLHILEFCAGMTIAWLARRGLRLRYPLSTLAAAAIAIVAIDSAVSNGFWTVLGDQDARPTILVGGALTALLLLGAVGWERSRPLTIPYPLRLLGAASYSIYLTHYLAIQLILTLARHTRRIAALPYPALCLAAVVFALVPGLLLHLLVEKPLLTVTSRLTRGPQPLLNPAAET